MTYESGKRVLTFACWLVLIVVASVVLLPRAVAAWSEGDSFMAVLLAGLCCVICTITKPDDE